MVDVMPLCLMSRRVRKVLGFQRLVLCWICQKLRRGKAGRDGGENDTHYGHCTLECGHQPTSGRTSIKSMFFSHFLPAFSLKKVQVWNYGHEDDVDPGEGWNVWTVAKSGSDNFPWSILPPVKPSPVGKFSLRTTECLEYTTRALVSASGVEPLHGIPCKASAAHVHAPRREADTSKHWWGGSGRRREGGLWPQQWLFLAVGGAACASPPPPSLPSLWIIFP